MKRILASLLLVVAFMLSTSPTWAATASPETIEKNDHRFPQRVIVGGAKLFNSVWLGPSIVFRPSTSYSATLDTTIQATTPSAARTYTIPDAGGNDSFVFLAATQTLTNKTLTSPTITNPIITGTPTLPAGSVTSAMIQSGSAKRVVERVQLSPATGAAADSTTYAGLCSFGRAGTVKRISFVCHVAPTVGVDTIEVLKNNTTTMLNAATFDANTLVADTVTTATLTATGADLALTTPDVIRLKYNAGAQTADAQDVTAIVEFEMTDF